MRSKMLALIVSVLTLTCTATVFAKGKTDAQTEGERAAAAVDALVWKNGTQPITERASILLPTGFRMLDPTETNKFLKLTGNLPEPESYTIAPTDLSWFAVMDFSQIGYVKDDETIDPDALLTTMRENQTASNERRKEDGLDPLNVAGWAVVPHYDKASHNLEYGLKLTTPDGQNVNYAMRLLGRRGVMTATLISDTATLDQNLSTFRQVLQGFKYAPSESYAAYQDGDPVSEYGLAALVTGGAAAAAIKAGGVKGIFALLAAFGKYIIIGIVALVAVFRNFFARLFRRGENSEML